MKKKSKILYLLHLPPPVHGSSVVGLSIKESAIINERFNGHYINLLASHNVAETGIVNFKKLFFFIITWIKVFVSVIRNRPNLCYLALTVTGAAFFKDLLLIIILKIFRIKRIYHLHNKGVILHQHKFFYRLCYKFVFKNAEVILISEHLYKDIQFFVPKSKVHFCPNGIKDYIKNSNDTLPGNKLLIKKSNSTIQLLFLSNLIESKGVFILLDACSILKRKELCFECIFIGGEGDITASRFHERVNQLCLNDIVNYQGEKFGIEKTKAYLEADIFVFPTYYETFGLVNLEAMQHSIPIISTLEGGIPDIIEDGITGFLIAPKNVEDLASKLELLIKNHDLRIQMGIAGRKKYEQQFTQQIFENRLHDIFQQILDN